MGFGKKAHVPGYNHYNAFSIIQRNEIYLYSFNIGHEEPLVINFKNLIIIYLGKKIFPKFNISPWLCPATHFEVLSDAYKTMQQLDNPESLALTICMFVYYLFEV